MTKRDRSHMKTSRRVRFSWICSRQQLRLQNPDDSCSTSILFTSTLTAVRTKFVFFCTVCGWQTRRICTKLLLLPSSIVIQVVTRNVFSWPWPSFQVPPRQRSSSWISLLSLLDMFQSHREGSATSRLP